MKYSEKVKTVQNAARGYAMNGKKYGENPYTDMQIENALLCDMFPEEVQDPESFHGYRRSDYILEPSAKADKK